MLSVRAGQTRRQGTLEIGKTLKFPAEVATCSEIQVDILVVCGRARLSLTPGSAKYHLQLTSKDGGCDMSCDLEVLRAVGHKPSKSPDERSLDTAKTVSKFVSEDTWASGRREVAMPPHRSGTSNGRTQSVNGSQPTLRSESEDSSQEAVGDVGRAITARALSACAGSGSAWTDADAKSSAASSSTLGKIQEVVEPSFASTDGQQHAFFDDNKIASARMLLNQLLRTMRCARARPKTLARGRI